MPSDVGRSSKLVLALYGVVTWYALAGVVVFGWQVSGVKLWVAYLLLALRLAHLYYKVHKQTITSDSLVLRISIDAMVGFFGVKLIDWVMDWLIRAVELDWHPMFVLITMHAQDILMYMAVVAFMSALPASILWRIDGMRGLKLRQNLPAVQNKEDEE